MDLFAEDGTTRVGRIGTLPDVPGSPIGVALWDAQGRSVIRRRRGIQRQHLVCDHDPKRVRPPGQVLLWPEIPQ